MWSSNLVRGMWQYGIDQWIGRNEFLYGKTKEDQYAMKSKEVDDQIVIMYQTDQQRVRPIDSQFFHVPLAQRLEQSLNRKQLWVKSVKLHMSHGKLCRSFRNPTNDR